MDCIDFSRLIEKLDARLLTQRLAYNLFIPYLEQEIKRKNEDALETMNEMSKYTEWLEDIILDNTRLKIKNKEISIVFPQTDGKFDRTDLNEFGYPIRVKETGEFLYPSLYDWGDSRYKEVSAIRDNHLFKGGYWQDCKHSGPLGRVIKIIY